MEKCATRFKKRLGVLFDLNFMLRIVFAFSAEILWEQYWCNVKKIRLLTL